MTHERRALVVTHVPGEDAASVDELTALLNHGWRLLSTTAMGGAGGAEGPVQFASLVVLEREDQKTVAGFGAR